MVDVVSVHMNDIVVGIHVLGTNSREDVPEAKAKEDDIIVGEGIEVQKIARNLNGVVRNVFKAIGRLESI